MDLRALGFGLWRFVVRTLRISAGLIVAYLVVALLVDNAIDLLSRPFAELSPLTLLGGIVLGVLSLLGFVLAFGIAFGEGPSKPQTESEIAARVVENMRRGR